MNLFLITINLSMLVLGVDNVKNSAYSSLEFTVNQSKLFKDELKIICNSFNAICNSNIDTTLQEDILRYCVEDTCIELTTTSSVFDDSLLPTIKDFNNKFRELSNIQELKPSYMFLNQILNAKKINISDIFRKVKKILSRFAFESINECWKMIQLYNRNSNGSYYDAAMICSKYVSSILELDRLITTFVFTDEERTMSGKALIKHIRCFIKKYHKNKGLVGIVPTMDDYTYNSYMLVLTILKLDDAIYITQCDCIFDDICWHENIRIQSIRKLITKLSVEIFMLFAGKDKHIISKMKDNITAANIKFWNDCQITKILNPRRILDINYYNLSQELKFNIIENLEYLSQGALITYKEMLEKFKAVISIIIVNKCLYGDRIIDYIDFDNRIDILIKKNEYIIENPIIMRNEAQNSHQMSCKTKYIKY